MSTGNDPALPADQPNPTVVDTAVAAVTTDGGAPDKPGLAFTSPQPVDVDEIELNEAKAAAQAENAAGTGDGQGGAPTGTDPAKAAAAATPPGDKTPPAAGQQPPVGETPMIPKARFDEVNNAKSEAERLAAYWRGRAEAGAAPQGQTPGGQQQQEQQPTPAQRLEQIHAAQDALATRFDNGEITRAEEVKLRRELDAKEAAIREDALTAKLKAAPAAPTGGNDELYLETLTVKLEDDHPWVKSFNAVASDSEWGFVTQKAREELTARNVELKGTIGSYELRKEISRQIDKLAPALIADRATQAQAAGFAFPGAQQQQQQQQPQTPSQQVIDRQAALKKAAGAPPDLNGMNGHTGDINGQPSDARLETMSDDEIGALPASVKNKLMGIQA